MVGVRVTPSLDTLGSFEFCNPADPDLIQNNVAVAFNGENYVAVWADEKYGGTGYYTTMTRITPAGVALDTGIPVNPSPSGTESRPNVACDPDRSFVVWTTSSGTRGRFVNSGGQPEGDLVTVFAGYAGGADLAFDGTNYLVTWFTGTYPALTLHAQLVSTAGALVGGRIDVITTPDCHRWADVLFDGTNFFVVWQTGDNDVGQVIYGQFVAPDGALIGGGVRICDNTTTKRWWPAAAASTDKFLVTWGQGTSSDIYGNIDWPVTGMLEPEPPGLVERPLAPTSARPSVMRGAELSRESPGSVRDVLGRRVNENRLEPGVYYLETATGTTHKVIVTR